MVTRNRLHRFWEHILIQKEYFDEVRIIDANSKDGTKEFCNLHGLTYIPYELKTSVVQDGYSKILKHAKDGEWLALVDSDEFLSRPFLQNMTRMVEESNNGRNYNIISTIPIDLALDSAVCSVYDKKAVLQELDIPLESTFKKEVLWKFYPNTWFEGTSHHYLTGFERGNFYVYYGYYHNKTVKEFCESCVFFTFADIINDDLRFAEIHFSSSEINYLKNLFSTKNINTIPKFYDFWNEGKFPKKFIEFCKKCFESTEVDRLDNGNFVSQRMGWFLYMFIYNKPELMLKKYKEFLKDTWFYKGNL
jgi:hypothetical protein